MNTLELSLELRYDDDGNLVSYELNAPVCGTPEVISIQSLDDPPSPVFAATRHVVDRLIGAINEEFKLPPITGMQR